MKHLYRSETNRVWKGIIGGLGEYYEMDPVVLRLGFVLLLLITGVLPCLIGYIAAIFIVPRKPDANA